MTSRLHIPDAVFITLAILVQLMTYGILLYVYPELPERIPTHYNISGQPDAFAVKNIFTVFFPAFLQTAVVIGLGLIYRHPQYAHIPGTLFLPLLAAPIRATIEHVIKHMMVMIMLLVSLLFANIAITTTMVAFRLATGLNGWVMGSLVGVLIFLVVEYNIILVRLVRTAMKGMAPNSPMPVPPDTAH